MRYRACAFAGGVVAALHAPAAPVALGTAALLVVAAALGRWRGRRYACFALAGCGYALVHVYVALERRIDSRGDHRVYGCVSSAVRAEANRLRFDLALLEIDGHRARGEVAVSWYEARRAPMPGECWLFRLRLSPPRGLLNRYGFDAERASFARGRAGIGYVLPTPAGRLVVPAASRARLLRTRLAMAARLRFVVGERPASGVLVALAVGLRHGIGAGSRETFARTGTSHLLAISGLHVGLAAGLGFGAGRWLWPWGTRRRQAGVLLAVLAAATYAALAGFALPTQRALIMLLAFALAALSRYRLASLDVLGAALLAVLVLDPFAPLGAGFWMSFTCVAALLALGGSGGGRAIAPQLLLFFALSPLLAALTGRVPLLAPLANGLCVPFYSFTVIPLTLGGLAVQDLHAPMAATLWRLAAALHEQALAVLVLLADSEAAVWLTGQPPLWTVLLATLGAALALVPCLSARAGAVVLALPLLLGRDAALAPGSFRLDVLDVGQGLAVLIETRHSTALYDTGDQWLTSDAGQAVILPQLAGRGRRQLQALIVSHADRDHAGGARSVLREARVQWRLTGEPQRLGLAGFDICRAGEGWQADGVRFEILHPASGAAWTGNDASCVLRVAGGGGVALLTGDIEGLAELDLVHLGAALEADIVLGLHHGSRTSSIRSLVAATRPELVVFSSGYSNRWDLPRARIVERWRAAGARVFDTGRHGALRIEVDANDELLPPRRERLARPAWWRHEGPD